MNLIQRALPVLIATLLPSLAMAHTGDHIHGDFSAGFVHPLLGLDHLLALIAAGIWLAQQSVRNRPLLGVGFIGALALGLLMGRYFPGAQFESGITATLICLGALIACSAKLRLFTSALILGAVAAVHGFVHGSELFLNAGAGGGFVMGLMLSSSLVFGMMTLIFARNSKLINNEFVMKCSGVALAVFGLLSAF